MCVCVCVCVCTARFVRGTCREKAENGHLEEVRERLMKRRRRKRRRRRRRRFTEEEGGEDRRRGGVEDGAAGRLGYRVSAVQPTRHPHLDLARVARHTSCSSTSANYKEPMHQFIFTFSSLLITVRGGQSGG